jgi:L-ascorbate 6-phosphate lactonase
MALELKNIRKDKPAKGKILIYWLAGAGFVFKFDNGTILCVDPYLSDYVERLVGFRRLTLAPVKPEELQVDLLLYSHEHPDHLDIDSYDGIMKANPKCRIIAAKPCVDFLKEKKAPYEMITVGQTIEKNGVTVRAVQADHGQLSPDALAFVITYSGRSIYFTADTSNDPKVLAEAIAMQPEIIVPCINGAFGNLTEKQAAQIARQCNAKIAIPCHFWLFVEHGGSPGAFIEALKAESPKTKCVLLTPGRGEEI